jgi:hypothetical protein
MQATLWFIKRQPWQLETINIMKDSLENSEVLNKKMGIKSSLYLIFHMLSFWSRHLKFFPKIFCISYRRGDPTVSINSPFLVFVFIFTLFY